MVIRWRSLLFSSKALLRCRQFSRIKRGRLSVVVTPFQHQFDADCWPQYIFFSGLDFLGILIQVPGPSFLVSSLMERLLCSHVGTILQGSPLENGMLASDYTPICLVRNFYINTSLARKQEAFQPGRTGEEVWSTTSMGCDLGPR